MLPQPRGHWLVGQLWEQRRDPLGLLVRGLEKYGDAVAYRFGPYRALQLNHPRLFKRVLVDNESNYVKWSALRRARPLLGDGLVLANGATWRHRRKIYGSAFRREHLRAISPTMVEATKGFIDHLSRLPEGTPINLLHDLLKLTLAIVSRSLLSRDLGGFGVDDDPAARELGHNFDEAVEVVAKRIISFNPLAGVLPTSQNRGFNRLIRAIDHQVDRIIADRLTRQKSDGEPRPDLLAGLMENDENGSGSPIDTRLLRDEILTILLSGRGTSAVGLTWMWWLLDRHPEIEERVRAEALAVLGPERMPTAEDLDRLQLTARVIQEALRLYPPIWVVARQAVDFDELDGEITVAPGTIILISPYVVHRHSALWPDPEQFDPDRFLPSTISQRSRMAWIPFGHGPRTCIGGSFAMQEALLITAMVVRQFRLCACSNVRPALEPLITLRPKGGLKVRVHGVGRESVPSAP